MSSTSPRLCRTSRRWPCASAGHHYSPPARELRGLSRWRQRRGQRPHGRGLKTPIGSTLARSNPQPTPNGSRGRLFRQHRSKSATSVGFFEASGAAGDCQFPDTAAAERKIGLWMNQSLPPYRDPASSGNHPVDGGQPPWHKMCASLGGGFMLRAAIALLASMLLASVAQAEKRVALVIGNSVYEHAGTLTNPKNDAADVAAALKKLDFQVLDAFDLDKAAFDRKVRDFAAALQGAEAGLFFFAGHGLQVAG